MLIGSAAGIIDVVPMITKKLDKESCLSAFVHYFALGLIIPFVNWDLAPWFSGICISLLTALPVMIIVYRENKRAIIPIFLFSVLLGAGIGLAGAEFIG